MISFFTCGLNNLFSWKQLGSHYQWVWNPGTGASMMLNPCHRVSSRCDQKPRRLHQWLLITSRGCCEMQESHMWPPCASEHHLDMSGSYQCELEITSGCVYKPFWRGWELVWPSGKFLLHQHPGLPQISGRWKRNAQSGLFWNHNDHQDK